MKIRKRIALFYAAITFGILLSVFSFVFIITSSNIKENFYIVLHEKALTTAQKNFGQDNMSLHDYERILENYTKNKLPEEQEFIFNIDSSTAIHELKNILSEDEINDLYDDKIVNFSRKEDQGVAIYYVDNEGDFIVAIIAEDKQGNLMLDSLFKTLFIVLFLSVIFIYIAGVFYAGQILNPLAVILKKVNHIRANNLEMRLKERNGSDELSQLIRTLNQMIERLEVTFKSQKSFISNASHELNNPLTAIMGEVEITLAKNRSEEEYKMALIRIGEEAARIDELTRDLLSLSHADLDISFDMSQHIHLEKLLMTLASGFTNRIDLQISKDDSFVIQGNLRLITIALKNILENACKYSSNDSLVFVTLQKVENNIIFTVKDNGIGISEEDLENIFQPFFRGKNTLSQKGHGIGLSLSERIISRHGGKLQVKSQLNQGTEVCISFCVS